MLEFIMYGSDVNFDVHADFGAENDVKIRCAFDNVFKVSVIINLTKSSQIFKQCPYVSTFLTCC